MSFSYLFDPNKQFQDRNGVNNVGGFLRVYIDGTDDRATTYKDFNGTLNEADIMLDSDGRAVVIVDDSLTFRIEVYERDGALQWTVTQFTARGEGDGGGSSTPVVVDGTANEIDVTERMTAGVKYYTIGLATVVKNTLLGLLASFSNLVGILNSKADKVQVATAGNLAALDASGNITDSGKKAADFKTKQTPVADPSASGNGLEFIDSVSQDANGEITPHKKSVQDGTTAQKGVVKLSNAIDSTSVTEAATPKAVKDAYDELNNKIVARAVFLSQAEWAVQSQLQGDPAKVYYVENGTGEDAYTVYVWRESTSTYEEVDESSIDLDGYWHDEPTTTGSGNVVTNITLGNDGVPQVEKGLTALTQHQSVTDNDPTLAWGTRSKVGTIGSTELHVTMPSNPASGKLDTTGNASNATSTLTKASGDTSSMTSGSKLSALFTAISSFFASVASALGDKADKVTSATNGNFASLDSNGNLTDSGKKAEDFAVSSVYNETDPRNLRSSILIHGTGTSFYKKIATMFKSLHSGNANFVLIRGFVGSWISNYENTEFELLIRTRQTLLMDAIVAKKYDKNPFTEIDFELYKEEDDSFSLWVKNSNSFTTGDFSVVAYDGANVVYDGTNGTPTGTFVASASQNYKLMMVTDGDGSNVSVTPDGTSTGYDLGSSTTLKAFAQKFKNLVSALKALAFKDKASYNDLSSGVQSSLDKADSALQSHQSVTDNNPTLAWGSTSAIGKVGSTDLRVTMPANPATYKVPFINIDSSLASLDINTLTTQGFYYCSGFVSNSVVLSNIPSELNNYTKSWRLEVIDQRSRIEQILVNASDNSVDTTRVMGIWKRHRFPDGTTWTPWVNNVFGSGGSPTTPVYVDSNGYVQPCDTSQMSVGSASTAQYAVSASNAQSNSTLETQVNKGLAAYKETYTNVTLIQGNIYSKTIVLEIGQENSSGNGIRLFLNNNNGTFEVSIRSGTWNSWMDGGSVIWMLQASFGVGVNSPVTKINNDTKSLAILTTQNIGGVDIGGSPGQYPVNGTISGRFYFVNNAASGILTFEASFSTSQSTQYGGLNDTFVIGKAEWTSFADHKVTSILT